MIQVGDYVLKGSDVYRIMEVSERSIGGRPAEDYLILDEAFSTKRTPCTAYVPVQKAEMTIRPVPTKQEVEGLLRDSTEDEQVEWIDNRNKRINEAREIISSGDLTEVIKLEKLYRRRTSGQTERELSGKDRELATRGLELLTHVTAASYGVTTDEASEVIERFL